MFESCIDWADRLSSSTNDEAARGLYIRFKIDTRTKIAYDGAMKTLAEVINEAEQLSSEDQAELATYLLAALKGMPLGPDDAELARREAEIDAGATELLTYEQLCKAVGR